MISQTDLNNNNAAYDVKGMDGLRQSAKAQDPGALKEAATQFEAMFINMMMKTMRDATPQDGIMDSQQSKMYTSMLDQQTSQSLAKRGTGLADALLRQLSASQPLATDTTEVPSPRSSSMAQALAAFRQQQNAVSDGATSNTNAKTSATQAPHVRAFQEKLGAHAEEASRATGIPAKFMLGQAALETGWGKKQIKTVDGSESHNVFGVKANSSWKGKTVNALTTEYVNGVAQRKVETFKAYDSYAEAFKDYANLLTKNPRYGNVIANSKDASSFAYGMQKAGYATDPQYANKLSKIIKQNLSA